MCQIYPNLQVIPILVASLMSSPLDFHTEGLGFESHQGHMWYFFIYFFFVVVVFLLFCFYSFFFLPHSLKNAQILMNAVLLFCFCFFVVVFFFLFFVFLFFFVLIKSK